MCDFKTGNQILYSPVTCLAKETRSTLDRTSL